MTHLIQAAKQKMEFQWKINFREATVRIQYVLKAKDQTEKNLE